MNSKLIFFLLDLFQQTSIRKYYSEFRRTLHFSRNEIKLYQKNKLIKLLDHSIESVPYYREAFKSLSLTDDAGFFERFSKLPILDRELLQGNNDRLKSVKCKKSSLHEATSSGTTGIPISYYYDKESLSAGIAAGYLAYYFSGWKIGNRSLHIWGNPTSVKHWNKFSSKIKRIIKNQTNISSTYFNSPENIEWLVKNIYERNFKSIDGYTTAIYELARFIEKSNNQKINSQYVFTTAENLQPFQQETIEKHIGPVSDLYGCGEINGIAIKPINHNKYYVIDPHVYVETVDEGNGLKSILVTDLDNYAMPLIRYKVGDLIDSVKEPDPSDFPRFTCFHKVNGRSSEIIKLPNGKKILPVNIVGGTLFRKIGKIKKHKVTWDGFVLRFLFEVDQGFNIQKANEMILNEFQDYNIHTEVITTEKLLPDTNGKYKYFEIINNE